MEDIKHALSVYTMSGNVGYIQQFYNYEVGAGSFLPLGPEIDWSGQYYFMRRIGNQSIIYQNYSPTNRTPFITIPGNVSRFQVTSDREASYLYYTLSGIDDIFRLPLVRNASNPERIPFQATGFSAASLTLTGRSDQFLVHSRNGRELTIALFSFRRRPIPIRTWAVTLPQDLINNLGRAGWGWRMVYEVPTNRIWVTAWRPYTIEGNSWRSLFYWFASTRMDLDNSVLETYSPASEVPGWNAGIRSMEIGRYARVVWEFRGENRRPDIWHSIREFDPVTRQLMPDVLTTFRDLSNNVRPLQSFFELAPDDPDDNEVNFGMFRTAIDAQKNLFIIHSAFDSTAMREERYQRFALFRAGIAVIEQPVAAPAANDNATLTNPVRLVASDASLPTGYVVEGSRWEIYRVGEDIPVYSKRNISSSNIHTVVMPLPPGNYEWRMSYDWVHSSQYETRRGATNWSNLARIVVVEVPPDSDLTPDQAPDVTPAPSSSGGCNSVAGGAVMLALISTLLAIRSVRK